MTTKDLQKETPQQALVKAFRTDLDSITPYLQAIVPYKGGPERFRQMTLLAIMRNSDLLACDRKSLLLAILWCAQKDLEPGVEDGCWLVPFKVKQRDGSFRKIVTPIPGYKGLIKKAVETESIRYVDVFPIYAEDKFSYHLGMDPVIFHQPPDLGKDRGELIGVYAVVTLPSGDKKFSPPMDRKQVEKFRDASAGYKSNPAESPWTKWEEAMFLKTAIKQGLKTVPAKPPLRDLISDDSRLEAGEAVGVLLREAKPDMDLGDLDKDTGGTVGVVEGQKKTEPQAVPKEKLDTFDKLMDAQLGIQLTHEEYEERTKRVTQFCNDTAKTKGSTGDIFKAWTVDQGKFELVWSSFLTWEQDAARPWNKPKEESKVEASSGGAWGVEQDIAADPVRVRAIWDMVFKKGCLEIPMQHQVNKPEDITAKNIEAIEKAVNEYQPPKRGRHAKS